MRRLICFISLILCMCLLLAGCSSHKKAERVEFFSRNITSFYILEYDGVSILSEKQIPERDIEHYSEESLKSARKIDDIIAEMPQEGYMYSHNEMVKGSQKVEDGFFGLSSNGNGFSYYELGFNITDCEEVYIDVKEKKDTFLVEYYVYNGYTVRSSKNPSKGLYAKRKDFEKTLIRKVEEVGKQNIYIRYVAK